jgi:hypothetical protein
MQPYFRLLLTSCFFSFAAAFVCGAAGGTVQRVSWEAVDGVFLYEVRIEKRGVDGAWHEKLVEMVENVLFLDCKLEPGYYRFSVRSFDILKRPGSVSEWAEFSVENGKSWLHRQKASSQDTTTAANGGQKNVYAADVFNNDIIRSKPLRMELLWTPLVPLPTGEYNAVFESAMFQAAGFSPRFTVLPLRFTVLQVGIEIMPSWNFLHGALHGTKENLTEYLHIFGANSAFVVQALILRNTAISARIGGSASFFYSQFIFNIDTDYEESITQFKWNPAVYGGVELNCFLGPSFVLSLGVEYMHVFAAENVMLGFIRPIFGMGVWF